MKLLKKNPSSQNQERFDFFKLWVPFSIIGIAMISLWVYGAANIYSMLASLQWPSTTGTIIRSEIKRASGTYRSTAPSKEAIIIYRYKLNDVVFSSNRILWGEQTYSAQFREPVEPGVVSRIFRTFSDSHVVTQQSSESGS